MAADDESITCRIAFVETFRAVSVAAGAAAARRFASEWQALSVIEVDQQLADRAARLAVARRLRSLDAIQLAAATSLPAATALLTWDARLHEAARAEGLRVLPEALA